MCYPEQPRDVSGYSGYADIDEEPPTPAETYEREMRALTEAMRVRAAELRPPRNEALEQIRDDLQRLVDALYGLHDELLWALGPYTGGLDPSLDDEYPEDDQSDNNPVPYQDTWDVDFLHDENRLNEYGGALLALRQRRGSTSNVEAEVEVLQDLEGMVRNEIATFVIARDFLMGVEHVVERLDQGFGDLGILAQSHSAAARLEQALERLRVWRQEADPAEHFVSGATSHRLRLQTSLHWHRRSVEIYFEGQQG
ncbi:MAG: hypothetical protein M1828_003740 [Chrysothrix sp. TS-e1954]|nr:MAG: hypothetical protein M1828_003740 [Chrysothrix sp. TS-e1954]